MTGSLPFGSPEVGGSVPTSVEAANIIPPRNLQPGETCVVVQRHQRYVDTDGDEQAGSLTPEGQEQEWTTAYDYFDRLLEDLSPQERARVRVFFAASDSDFKGEGGERSYETAVIAQQAAEAAFIRHGVDPAECIINTTHGERGGDSQSGYSQVHPTLREPQIFVDSPDFVAFLRQNYPNFKDMMGAYEDDRHRDVRVAMGAEGPTELANRLGQSIDYLARYAGDIHAAVPDSRVIVWAVSHYDTISPFVKREFLGIGMQPYLPVEYGGGFTVEIDAQGTARARLGSRTYAFTFASRA